VITVLEAVVTAVAGIQGGGSELGLIEGLVLSAVFTDVYVLTELITLFIACNTDNIVSSESVVVLVEEISIKGIAGIY